MRDTDVLRSQLQERRCKDVRVESGLDGAVMLRTRFRFHDGDRMPIHVSVSASGSLRLSDGGHTLMRISYAYNVNSLMDGTRGMILERTMRDTGFRWDVDHRVLFIDTPRALARRHLRLRAGVD